MASHPPLPSKRSLPSPDMHASGPGWASEDSLSPQDVILNYFDYQPGAGKGRAAIPEPADAGYNGDTPGVFSQPHDYPPLSFGRNGQARLQRLPNMMIVSPIRWTMTRLRKEETHPSGRAAGFSARRPWASLAASQLRRRLRFLSSIPMAQAAARPRRHEPDTG